MRIAAARLAAPFALALGLAAASGAHAADDPLRQPRSDDGVKATEAAWVAALKARDVATLDRLLADDFVDTTWQGALRRKPAILGALTAQGGQPNEIYDLSVVRRGDTAICRGLNTIHGPDGAVRARLRFTDVFLYGADGWRAVSAQETLVAQP
ncbi:MAG TPA: nuclear transport factor 2 family protein [Phenylobacterium sp.]|jgi:ketosteroid isomerase-like protein|uniref:nuclear transport factor 2 family protein n=1 Tax=Phenylobacterium sp. TaxID=1871053 RepID=UPI002D6A1CDC|nr:nuclear transport factor 2 family protein [Phenylobacterium sp.]HZZ67438.1 nuclear transport factor 2 family protein [Phenylobacterium sp.]